MSRRAWLRHPARTVRARLTCPTGEQRYATSRLAESMAVYLALRWGIALRVDACSTCGGYHLSVRRDGGRR